jgi:hypothetical protein
MPSILEQSQEQVKLQLDRLQREQTSEARLDLDLEKAELQVQKNWTNGWGIAVWARQYWKGTTEAGARIVKKLGLYGP